MDKTRQVAFAALKVYADLLFALLTRICIGKRTTGNMTSPGCIHENQN